jgi:hypothetical protein
MATLIACPTCKRHARRAEERCPFCGVPLSEELSSKRAQPPLPGLSRARLYAFQAAMATGVATACGGTGSPDAGSDATADGTMTDGTAQDSASMDVASMDGANGADAAADTGSDVVSDALQDHIIPPPPYGCVFPEACGVRV